MHTTHDTNCKTNLERAWEKKKWEIIKDINGRESGRGNKRESGRLNGRDSQTKPNPIHS